VQVREHFISLVDSAVSASEAAVTGYVRRYIQQQLAQARHTVKEYGERWAARLKQLCSAASLALLPLMLIGPVEEPRLGPAPSWFKGCCCWSDCLRLTSQPMHHSMSHPAGRDVAHHSSSQLITAHHSSSQLITACHIQLGEM
jgi:hypothetical protein